MSQSVSTAAVAKVATVCWLPLMVVVLTQIQASFAVRNRKRVLDKTDATPARVDAAVAITEDARDAESEKAV